MFERYRSFILYTVCWFAFVLFLAGVVYYASPPDPDPHWSTSDIKRIDLGFSVAMFVAGFLMWGVRLRDYIRLLKGHKEDSGCDPNRVWLEYYRD
jgi:purine-cytosine permease-like protein